LIALKQLKRLIIMIIGSGLGVFTSYYYLGRYLY
jgi:hypothetical protein